MGGELGCGVAAFAVAELPAFCMVVVGAYGWSVEEP